jgi:hypothetical protein
MRANGTASGPAGSGASCISVSMPTRVKSSRWNWRRMMSATSPNCPTYLIRSMLTLRRTRWCSPVSTPAASCCRPFATPAIWIFGTLRRDGVVPIILQATNATTASALGRLNRVVLGLGGNDLLLEACQHLLPVGHAQTPIGDIVETIRSVDRHEVGKRLVTVSPDLHQPHNPSHASTPGQIQTRKYRSGTRTPKLAAVPAANREVCPMTANPGLP